MTLKENDYFFKPKGLLLISFFCLFLYGFIDNLKGVTLPEILSDLNFTYSLGGVIQQGAYLGFLVATLATGYLLQQIKHQKILLIAAICLIVGISVYSSTQSASLLLAAMVAIGLGLGFLDLIGIRIITDFFSHHTGRLLNLSAFFHGLASMSAPIYAGFVIGAFQSWKFVYQFSLFLVVLFLLLLTLIGVPNVKNSLTRKIDLRVQIINALRDKKIRLYYVLIVSYEVIEIGVAVWLNEYLLSSANLSSTTSVSYLSLFFFFLTVGRLIGSLIIDRIGNLSLIFYASLGVILCLILGIFGGSALLIFLPLTGFFLSVIFPTTTAAASQDAAEKIDMSLSLLLTFAGLGGMIGSWAIGAIADIAGIQIGMSFLILMAINITVLTRFIMNLRLQNTPQTLNI
jgi:fucose permease